MDCVITVKGDGKGKYGHPKADRTGPVSEFLVDNQVFYTAISKHLKNCDVCDPVEILKVYLDRRLKNPKFNQMVSDSLVKQALKLERLCDRRRIACDPKLINEFIWRSNAWEVNGQPLVRLSIREIVSALLVESRIHHARLHGRATVSSNSYKIRVIAGILLNKADVDDQTLDELIQVAEVQLC